MTYFLKSGSRYNVSTQASMDLHETLPVGTYTVKQNPMTGAFFLETIDNFEIKGKVYGDTQKNATRILDTFNDRTASTGVMLGGEKGSGKTLLAKMLSLDGQMQGYPTIIINQPWCGEEFNGFMQMIEQPTVIIFDEFEKVYDREDQEKMLTLLDGVYPSKKLFVITCNDKYRVNEHMKNRPGRIFYRIDYAGLESSFIVEYCEDNLKNKTHIDTIVRIAMTFTQFNFDILKAMVEEMNRYDESPQEAMALLNAKPEQDDAAEYHVSLFIKGVEIPEEATDGGRWRGNPLMGIVQINYAKGEYAPGSPAVVAAVDEYGDRDYTRVKFSVSDLQSIDSATGKLHFTNSDGAVLYLSRVRVAQFDYSAF